MKNSLFVGIPYAKVTGTTMHTSQIMPRSSLGVTNSHVFMWIYKHFERVMMWGASGSDPCSWSSWWPTLVSWRAFSASVLCSLCPCACSPPEPRVLQSPDVLQVPCSAHLSSVHLTDCKCYCHCLELLAALLRATLRCFTQMLSHLPFANFSQAPALQSLPETTTKASVFWVTYGFLQGSRPLTR